MRKIERVAILGAGNGGCAAAADLTLAGFEVRLYGRSPETVEPLQKLGGVEYEGVLGEGTVRLPMITRDIHAAMKDADAVIVMAPAQAHENIAELIAPHLKKDQLVFAAPGHTLTLIPNTLRRLGHAQPLSCGTSTLPYICRKVTPTKVKVSRKSARLIFSAFPARNTEEFAERLKPLFPSLSPVPTVLDALFRYTNAIHHPPALLCNVGRVEWTEGDYCHYYEGITPSVGKMIDSLDKERLATAAAFGCKVDKLSDYFFGMGYTNEAGRDGGTAYDVFHNSEPNRWIKAPQTVDHRFFNEDIPFGLVPFSELAKVAGMPCESIDAVITLATVLTGKPYRQIGLNRERMGFAGLNAQQVCGLVEEGYPA